MLALELCAYILERRWSSGLELYALKNVHFFKKDSQLWDPLTIYSKSYFVDSRNVKCFYDHVSNAEQRIISA